MKILGIIPARYASTRLPGKPLVYIKGKTMIQRVYDNASKAKSLNEIIVATDDDRIYEHVEEFGGKVAMTSTRHNSGTDRCCEVVKIFGDKYPVVINIQGDEPFIKPQQIDQVSNCFDDKTTQIATLAKDIDNFNELVNYDVPKVTINTNKEAVYFSRFPIPFFQNLQQKKWLNKHKYYKHIGIYGFRSKTLLELTQLKQSPLEKAESLEQLRWIDNGYKIKIAITRHDTHSIDTPEDLKRIKA